MTRKHFEALAEALRVNLAKRHIVEAIADVCAQDNPRFDRERFLIASGFERALEFERKERESAQ